MEPYIPLKTSLEVKGIQRTCINVAGILHSLAFFIRAGITTRDINRYCIEEYKKRGLVSSFLGFKGFPESICTSVNHVAAHGIPDNRVLMEGDILTVDLTAQLEGWHGDAAWTYRVGNLGPDARRVIKAAWHATSEGCRAAKAGGRFGDIGEAIQTAVARYGCQVLENFVGHGIGRSFHEEPMVLNKGEKGTGRPLVPGLVFTIEPIVTLGDVTVKTLEDGWTVVVEGGGLCAQYEHTLALGGSETRILTFPGGQAPWDYKTPPY
ncbi:MAG: type I methionyl aminopeptidase [Spirochaetales bacterium]|nr:type I methionyl aminopeptidase [Spirochaetales bacterium]